MMGKLLARLVPRSSDVTDDVTDPEVADQYRREAKERRQRIERDRTLLNWISGNLAATVERNHFVPDISTALRAGSSDSRKR